jgi:hypothetical protein|tara:strand:+ start:440 stop:676 length:237 start_codon:yes stop_codon:yes gene_type:complete
MCLGMRTSSPTVYRRPNPQDIYYNGNIYDPKPQDVIDAENQAKAQDLAAKTLRRGGDGEGKQKRDNLLNKSSTGLQIT